MTKKIGNVTIKTRTIGGFFATDAVVTRRGRKALSTMDYPYGHELSALNAGIRLAEKKGWITAEQAEAELA